MRLNLLTICSEMGGASQSALDLESGDGLSHPCLASYQWGDLEKVTCSF